MDHMTRTIAFNQGKHSRAGHSRLGESTELDTRREMLDRRYSTLKFWILCCLCLEHVHVTQYMYMYVHVHTCMYMYVNVYTHVHVPVH